MHNEYLMMKFENMVYEMNNDKLKHQIKMMKDKTVFLKNELRSKTDHLEQLNYKMAS